MKPIPAAVIFLTLVGSVWLLSEFGTPPIAGGNGKRSLPRPPFVEQEGGPKRAEWEFRRLRDPKTGRIPEGISRIEREWVRGMPIRISGVLTNADGTNSLQAANTYIPVGPTQNGGRIRALAYDIRYNGTTNQVILTGGINGGIFRSTNGGQTWTFVHPLNELRSVSCLAQDPRPGFQDTWYAGTGEGVGVSAIFPAGFVIGNGVFKSTDNGQTWSLLSSTADNNPANFSFFDIVHRIAVNPTNGHVYAAIQQRIMRSTDGGSTWSVVLNASTPTSSVSGITDVMVDKAGNRLFAALSGRVSDRGSAGVWTSSTGNAGEWTRIAGGLNGQADSVAGWQPYNNATSGGEFTGGWGRIVFGLAPSNQNLMYVVCENGDKASDGKPEADLFRCDMSATPFAWTRLTSALTAKLVEDDGTREDTWYETQGGYDMAVAVHPTQPNIVYLGGVNLYRSSDGFATAANTVFAGGYGSNTYDDPTFISHVDYHLLVFDPSNANRLVTASDGGLVFCNNAQETRVRWNNMNSQLQTIQYYFVGIDPTPGSRVYFGGCQDNSTTLRDAAGFFGSVLPDSNDHYILIGGDGCQVGMSKKNVAGQQHLFASAQEGFFLRMRLFEPFDNTLYTFVKPSTAGTGEFVTYYHLDDDNTDFLYYASFDSLYRTPNSLTVTANTGWTLMSGISGKITGSIFAMATTRGPYSPNSHLFIGTDQGRVYRLKDPQGAAAASTTADLITPTGMSPGSVVSDIAVNPRNHDTVMVVASNYGISSIFWTGNATSATPTWQVVEGNLTVPSVRSCAIVAKKSGVEYYAGTSVGLFSATSLSGSATAWSREVGGPMTTAIVNSLAYRWQDNTLVVGTHGNGMFVANIGDAVNLPTPVNDPVRDDPNFIGSVYPTMANRTVNYRTGKMTGIRKVRVRVTSLSGQVLIDREEPYRSGSVDVGRLSKGMYILTITSNDGRYQHVTRFFKD
jgi:hypothetical protein